MSYQFLEPYTFKNGIKVKNRVVIPPMTECMSFADGTVTSDECNYFNIHTGGAGMFITGCAFVNEEGRGYEGELGASDDKFIPGLTRLASAIKQNGTKAILQVFSAGRMSTTAILRGKKPVSASEVPAPRPGAETPRALKTEEVDQLVKDFGEATRRAIQAGFDGIEIHGANTYLIQQFFSPHSNRRTDKWGGSLEKRMRFPLAIIDEVSATIKKYADRPFLFGYRISPEEIEEPGIRFSDTLALIDEIVKRPVDYLHVSMGTVWRTSLNNKDDKTALNLEIKERIGDMPLIGVGDVEKPEEAEDVIDKGMDFVAIGRESIREPHWVQKVEANDEKSIRYDLSLTDLDELGIKAPFWDFIMSLFGAGMHVTGQNNIDRKTYRDAVDQLLS
ncbi:NADH-dependent flavin oxidoreductase [Secundilactobacillus hailunensis]|uniref:NADH-dependent flavin oxidoreductase n=1 Tax=Secundilactobacillus hailunensis TaxID=2559923 RepID=A0ABW1T6V9_9LACO|nr:NADH-dependent flavin oxidoreductase [Secundilactobacillus hailunensis]